MMKRLLAMACAVFEASVAVGVSTTDGDGENLNFERGSTGWKLPSAYSVKKGEGMNGTAALVYENSNPGLPYAFPVYYNDAQDGRSLSRVRQDPHGEP